MVKAHRFRFSSQPSVVELMGLQLVVKFPRSKKYSTNDLFAILTFEPCGKSVL